MGEDERTVVFWTLYVLGVIAGLVLIIVGAILLLHFAGVGS